MRDAPPPIPQDTPAIAVLMPLRGTDRMLETSIATVLAQSSACWELLLIDDGTHPAGLAVARKAALADPRIRILHHEGPPHPGAARNLGAMLARAPLLAFLEPGDLWATGRLVSHLARHRARPHLVATFARMAFLPPETSTLIGARRCSTLPDGPLTLPDVLGRRPSCTAGNLVVTRRALLVGGGFDETLAHAQDQDLLARLVRDGAPIEAIDAVLTGHRFRPVPVQDNWRQVIARHVQGPQARRLEALHCRAMARHVLVHGGGMAQALPHAMRALRLDTGHRWWGVATMLACLIAPMIPTALRRRLFA
jgi:glycosyltransferase involved in cell wall biosynthesis